jgi:nicotinate-nucleotide adenylyltransferase
VSNEYQSSKGKIYNLSFGIDLAFDIQTLNGGSQIKRESSGRRIGLFGGTFNPIHVGHLRGAEEIRETFSLHQVVFIPSATPPHKVAEEIIDSRHRLEMVERAITSNPFFSASDIELRRSGKSYSIDTLRSFRRHVSGFLFFIVGRDAFVEIETWKEFQQLFSLSNFIVMTRPGSQRAPSASQLPDPLVPFFRYDERVGGWVHLSGHTLCFKEITYLDISSTKVRELIERGESVKYLTPPEVETYIAQNGLYRR